MEGHMTKGERIRKRREQLGLSQTEVANSVNVSKQTLYKYENDIVTNIPSDKIEALARKLETTPEFLMGWEVPKKATDFIMIGGNARPLPVFAEGDDIEKALELYKAYSYASPDVQSAIEILLKSHLSDA
jgi:transcriptional regulator with XRE-family HTH domain